MSLHGTVAAAGIDAPALSALQAQFGEKLAVSPSLCTQYGAIEGVTGGGDPQAVLFASTTQDVVDAVRICAAHGIPVIAHGAGTSLEGQLSAPHGGLSIAISGMDRVLEINAEDLDVKVEAGITREALNAELRSHGLFFPLDPGANASIGGMAATRASGTNAVRYGTMREVTLGLTVVTADGEVIETGTRARKSASGYDLTRLFVGSEGTLGIITELRLRVFGLPEDTACAVVQFPTLDAAVQTVMLAMQTGLQVARIELLDELQMRASISYSGLTEFAPAPTLFLEFSGSRVIVADQLESFRALAGEYGASSFAFATRTEDRTRLWRARHNAWFAAKSLRPGAEAFATDACVPISRLAEAITEARAAAKEAGFVAPIVGHVGDGNFHMLVLYDPRDPDELHRAEALSMEVAKISIRMGGTATGEHGIGLHKLAVMQSEHSAASLRLMKRIKQSLDPRNILNPGKTIPHLE